jgi:hypothetical protein
MLRNSFVAVIFALVISGVCSAQTQGTFSGTVTDPNGAGVPKAKIVATDRQKSTKTETVSEDSGAYTLPFLAPGIYDITAQAPGFKVTKREGVTLDADAHPVINLKLDVGEVNEAITVRAESPLITGSNASIGQTITTKEVENLPVNGRTPLMLDTLAMGAISTFQPGPVRPFDQPAATELSLGGAPVGTNESMLDGAPNAGFGNQLAYSPPEDAVVEVRVNAFESDASLGHTGGGTLNQITKSGTNEFHGSLWEFNQTSFLDANSFFTNKAGQSKPPYHYNQYGVAVGGPVWIPKLYNGRNKLFWFFAYEGLKDSDPANSPLETGNPINFASVPTTAERTGDFSALLKLGSQYQIYNPYSATQTTSSTGAITITRQPFANNVIPASLLNPVSLKILNFYPTANAPGLANGSQNYLVNAIDTDQFDNELGRLDYNIGNNDKLYFTSHHNYRQQFKSPYFGNSNVSQGNYFYRINQGAELDETHTFSPTMFLDTRLSWTRYIEIHSNPSDGFNLTSLGFPSTLQSSSQEPQFPVINMSSCSVSSGAEASFQCLGYNGNGSDTYDAYQIYVQAAKISGNHSLKFGTDLRDYRWSSFTLGNSAGAYTFGNASSTTNAWTNGPTSTSASSPFGQDFAEFMLGLPTSGSLDNNTTSTVGSHYYAFFLQDDWRARSNLTINLGLRFEHESPATERYNRAVNGYNPAEGNPISNSAASAYASLYSTGAFTAAQLQYLPAASSFNALGGLTFASPSNANIYKTPYGTWSPRVGFAWTPSKLGGGTVIRAGFGMFTFPVEILDNGSTSGSGGGLGTFYRVQQEGFSQTTQFVGTNNNFLSPAANLSNPFPNGILPQGASLGAGAFLGQQVTFFSPSVTNPYSIRWDFSIERQLPGQIVVEAAYIGNHAVHLPISQQLDFIPRQYLDPSTTVRNNALNSLLSGTVKNPFKGLLPNSSNLNGSTIALDQLLIPFPQYPIPTVPTGTSNGIFEQGTKGGSSYFNSLDVRAQKRFTNGLTFIDNFIWSKETERIAYLNDSDPAPEKRISADSRPLREVLAAVYELPFGNDKAFHFKSRWANTLLGDWTLSGDLTFQSGAPLSWGNVIYYGGPLDYNAHQPNGYAFNISQFNTVSSQQLVFNIRSFSTMFNNLRQDPTKNLDLSVVKNFLITEGSHFELRFETFNTTNRVGFAGPQLSPTNAAFGIIGAQANTPRRVQIGARLVW